MKLSPGYLASYIHDHAEDISDEVLTDVGISAPQERNWHGEHLVLLKVTAGGETLYIRISKEE